MAGPILFWSLVLVALLVSGTLTLKWLRGRLLGEQSDDEAEGWTLHGLRQMRAKGQLSESEFERAKQVILDQHSRTSDESQPAGLRAEPGYDLAGDPLPGSSPSPKQENEPDRPSD